MLVITLFGGETTIDGTKVIVHDQQLPLLAAGQRVLLVLSRRKIGSREVYQPVFETLGVFDLTEGTLRHIHGLEGLYRIDKKALVEMMRK